MALIQANSDRDAAIVRAKAAEEELHQIRLSIADENEEVQRWGPGHTMTEGGSTTRRRSRPRFEFLLKALNIHHCATVFASLSCCRLLQEHIGDHIAAKWRRPTTQICGQGSGRCGWQHPDAGNRVGRVANCTISFGSLYWAASCLGLHRSQLPRPGTPPL